MILFLLQFCYCKGTLKESQNFQWQVSNKTPVGPQVHTMGERNIAQSMPYQMPQRSPVQFETGFYIFTNRLLCLVGTAQQKGKYYDDKNTN